MKQKIIAILSIIFLIVAILIFAYVLNKNKSKADNIELGSRAYDPSLPYLTHYTGGFSRQMLDMHERGHAILPTFPTNTTPGTSYQIKTLLKVKDLGLPVDLIGRQIEMDLFSNDYTYKDIDRDSATNTFTGSSAIDSANPNNIKLDGVFDSPLKLDPLGPEEQINLWREIGARESGLKTFKFMTEAYPSPYDIRMVNNYEVPRMEGISLYAGSKRYGELGYPAIEDSFPNTTECPYFAVKNECTRRALRNRVAGDGWMERYRAMFQSWRDNTIEPSWKNIKFLAYGAFPDLYFRAYRSANWAAFTSTHTTYESDILPDTNNTVPRLSYYPYAWDGGSPEIYLKVADQDIYLVGPQFGTMNWVFMLKDARIINPDYYFEISVWDGDNPLLRDMTPDRYAGNIQYSMWMTRPQAIREFKSNSDTWEQNLPQFLALTKIVDRVHNQPVLKDFWQNGSLVENPVGHHPFQAVTMAKDYFDEDIRTKYDTGRWFHLYSNLDEPNRIDQDGDGIKDGFADFDDSSLATKTATNVEIPVFSTALVKGTTPNREWLVYTYSPKQDRTGVTVTVPDFGDILVNPKQVGSFYHLKESDNSVVEILDSSPALTHLILNHEDPIIAPGADMQFSVVSGKDQYDGDMVVTDPINWSATGGVIDGDGLFTAGSIPGKYQIVVAVGGISEIIDIEVRDLLGFWKLDEGIGKTYAADSSGRNMGCYNFDSWTTTGKFSAAGNFDGLQSGANCSTDEYSSTPKEFTLSAWINVGETADGTVAGVYSDNQGLGYSMRFNRNSSGLSQIAFLGTWVTLPTITSGSWHHAVVQYKSLALPGGGFAKVYFDGQLIKTYTNVPSEITKGYDSFRIGQINASIDQIRLYNKVLSDTEIADLYNEITSSDPNITLVKSVDKINVQPGETITYTITYENTGTENIVNAVISDIIPDTLSIINAPGAEVNGQALTWTIPLINVGAGPQSLEFQCRVN